MVAATFAAASQAQVMQAPGTMPDGRRVQLPGSGLRPGIPRPTEPRPAAVPPMGTGAAGAPNSPGPNPAAASPHLASLLDKPAQPARVTLSGGSLAVDANNSSLSQILDQLSTSSGMTVDGLGQDQRVFGTYGPGNPRDVLSSLLDGAGYNFLMVGATENGTPREIVLTARSNAPLTSPQSSGPSAPEEEEEPISNNYPPEPEVAPQHPPGATPTTDPNAPPGQPRSPAEIMQELQRIRQQQQQQQQQSPQ